LLEGRHWLDLYLEGRHVVELYLQGWRPLERDVQRCLLGQHLHLYQERRHFVQERPLELDLLKHLYLPRATALAAATACLEGQAYERHLELYLEGPHLLELYLEGPHLLKLYLEGRHLHELCLVERRQP
jgi:hypothetical protein